MTSMGMSGCTIPALPTRPIHPTDSQMPFPVISATTAATVIQRAWLEFASTVEQNMHEMIDTMRGLIIRDDELTDLIFRLGDYPEKPQVNGVFAMRDITNLQSLLQMPIQRQWDRWANEASQHHSRMVWILSHCQRKRRREQD